MLECKYLQSNVQNFIVLLYNYNILYVRTLYDIYLYLFSLNPLFLIVFYCTLKPFLHSLRSMKTCILVHILYEYVPNKTFES